MSTSLLYHAFGMKGYKYLRTQYQGGRIIFEVYRPCKDWRCSACGSIQVSGRGNIWRLFRGTPIGKKPVWVSIEVPRVECHKCKVVRQIRLGFANPKVRHTQAFARHVLDLSRLMTLQDVAKHLGISWHTVKEVQKAYLKKRFSKPRLKGLKHLAIDEISVGHGQRYLTVVLDISSGAVVFVGKGRGTAALEPFWRRLRPSGAKIKAVAMDMSAAYIKAVRDNLPKSAIVFDHFHIIKLFNEKLSDLRRELYHDATARQKKVLKGSRWLLLKNPDNLDGKKNEERRLKAALKLNEPLSTAYYLKEDLRQLWKQAGKRQAGKHLTQWRRKAEASGVAILMRFSDFLKKHRRGILAWYDYRISTGPLEGTNNKIKTMQRQAYGYRDEEFYMLKIYALHEAKHVLVG